jgi:hypothetical protein
MLLYSGLGIREAETAEGVGEVYPDGLLLFSISQLGNSEVLEL